jgi:hypothetical protein
MFRLAFFPGGQLRPVLQSALILALAGSAGFACSSETPEPAHPATTSPGGATSTKLGAPKDTRYKADIEAQRGHVRVIVREESMCDVIPIRTVVEDGQTKWIADPPTTSQPCEQRVTRNGVISLEVNGNTYRLGVPNAFGELQTQLSDRVQQDLYGEVNGATPIARVMLRDKRGGAHEIGTLQLTQLAKADQRLEELLSEFRALLELPQEKLSGADLARSYELYEQLAAFDSSNPRIGALQALFIDRLYQRKAEQATEQFKKNIEALNAARDILTTNRGVLVLPGFVTSALDGGVIDAQTAGWARGQAALALHRNRGLCGNATQKTFTWSLLALSPPEPKAQLAFQVLRFAYDEPYEKEIAALCQRIVM